jgi:hypothetical protein
MRIAWVLTVAAALGCGASNPSPDGGGVPPSGPPAGGGQGGAPGGGPRPIGLACPDLFDPGTLRTYAIDIDPAELEKVRAEFNDVASLTTKGNDFVARHPVVFHLGSETVSDATLKLHGQSSWAQAATMDGDRAKMQFDISFHQHDPDGKFHGVSKLVFDMPRSDWTFMHDRLAHAWLRQNGIAAGCAANAKVEINGSYYGLFVVEEHTAKKVIKDFFPDNAGGDLWKGGVQPQTNQMAPNWDRQMAFTKATTIADVAAIVDIESSVSEWAAEALLNNGDGAYGGNHNFYIYDQGAKGFVFLPNDTDATFEWMALFDRTPYDAHPIYWWSTRDKLAPGPTATWLAVMNDPASRAKYVDAIAAQLQHWDVAQLQGWIDDWSAQIADAATTDPHAWATPDQFEMAVALARDAVAKRRDFLETFVACGQGGAADDNDGDGVPWCFDCRDDDAAVSPHATEICGNGVDDDCDGAIDDGCR